MALSTPIALRILRANRRHERIFSKVELDIFDRLLQDYRIDWEEVVRRPNPRNKTWHDDVWWVTEPPMRSAEGYRIIWVHSQLMAEADERSRLKPKN